MKQKLLNSRWALLRTLVVLFCLTGYARAQVTTTFNCTGSAGSYASGSVSSAGAKNDGNMITINSGANRGWGRFDLSGIPAGSTISSATITFTTYSSTLSTATNNIYTFTGDPATMTGTALYTACGSGTSVSAASWAAGATITQSLNATGISYLASAAGGFANLGFVRGSTNTYNIYGYPGTTAQQPQLTITYIPSGPMTYSSATVEQASTLLAPQGASNLQIVRLKVNTSGSSSPFSVSDITVNTTGTTTSLSNITAMKVYYTGSSTTFSTATQFGSTVNSLSTSQIVYGTQILGPGSNYFWVTYDISATTPPGDILDAEIPTFSLSSTPYTPTVTNPAGSRTVTAPMAGTYTVGTGGNFTTLQSAFDNIAVAGLSANVNLNIISDLTVTATQALSPWPEAGAGNYTVTIAPSGAARTIQGSLAGAAIIQLNGADRVVFDGRIAGSGRNLSIVNNDASTTNYTITLAGQSLANGCENVTIRNCNIRAGSAATSGTVQAITAQGESNHNLSILNNYVARAFNAIVTGSGASARYRNLIITGNSIGDTGAANYVINRGILVSYADTANISGNSIANMITSASLNNAAIELNVNVRFATLNANNIQAIRSTSSGGWGAYGIFLSQNSDSNVVISNNLIADVRTSNYSTTSTVYNAFGLKLQGQAVKVYNNTINLFGSVPDGTASGMSACVLIDVTINNFDFKNNVLSNTTAFTVANSRSYAVWNAGSAYASSNYNDYYAPGNANVTGAVGYGNSANITTLAAWRTYTTADAASVNADPKYTSATSFIPKSSLLDNTAQSLAAVTTDITGATRSGTPDMGAYEFTAPVKVFSSMTVNQVNGGAIVAPGVSNIPVLRYDIATVNDGGSLLLNSLNVTGANTNNNDVTGVKLYVTKTTTFSTAVQIGSTATFVSNVAAFSGLAYNLAGDSTTYVWVAYDVTSSSTALTHQLDASAAANSVSIGSSTYPATAQSPSGYLTVDVPATYVSSIVTQANTGKVGQGTTNNEMFGITITTSATGAPIYTTQLDLNVNGSTDTSNIRNIRVWYTGSSNAFATTTQFGSTLAFLPGATSFSVTGSQALTNGANYFWVTYDVSATATIGNLLDGECSTLTVAGNTYAPANSAPSGSRQVRAEYCTPVYSYASSSCGYNYYITKVQTTGAAGNINNATGCAGTVNNSIYYPNVTLTANRGSAFSINITDLYGYDAYTVWIDYDGDGIFNNTNEKVYASNAYTASATGTITIPCSATPGQTRMRVRSSSYQYPNDPCTDQYYGETEDYNVVILANPAMVTSSTAVQQTGSVAPGTIDRPVLRIPVQSTGCGASVTTSMVFNTIGTTNVNDIVAAKIYATGNSTNFNTSKLVGTVYSPNGSFTFTVQDTLLTNDVTNYWLTYDVSGSAVNARVIDARLDSILAGAVYYKPTVGNPSGNILIDQPMTYVSSTATQSVTTKVAQGTTNNQIIGVEVVTSATGSPIYTTQFDFNTNGTTDTSNIRNIKLWYTGNSNAFATSVQVGTTLAALPSSTSFSMTGSQQLNNGTNYFWLSYDVTANATIGNALDAELVDVIVGGNYQVPTTSAPAGNRLVRSDYCTASLYTNACSSSDFINNVSTTGGATNVSNLNSGCSGNANNFTYYPAQVLTVAQNGSFTISYQSGSAYGQGFKVWIDYDQDGLFSNAELVSSSIASTVLNTATITVPCSALAGNTRMRVRCAYNAIPANACSTESYGETEDYAVVITANPAVFNYSTAIQQTGTVAPGTNDKPILRIPVKVNGCGVALATNFNFATTGTTAASDILAAKLYVTGNSATFNTSKMVGIVYSPNGVFTFSGIQDTLVSNDTTNYWLAYDVNPSAVLGHALDARLDSAQLLNAYRIPATGNPAGNVTVNAPMTYVSSTTTQPFTSSVAQGTTNNAVIRVEVVMSATGSSIPATSFDISTNGTTSLSDISNLKIWYTGASTNFATTTQFGSTVAAPASTQSVTGSQPLVNGSNYFWVTYDVAPAAVVGNVIDAECNVLVAGTTYAPTVSAPAGNRAIRVDYCTTSLYSNLCSSSDYVENVSTTGGATNISNLMSGCNGNANNFIYYPSNVLTVAQGAYFTINYQAGAAYGQGFKIWIDFNQDGAFDPVTELIATASAGTTLNTTTVAVPLNALTGNTRMRVRCAYNAIPTSACSLESYGETEDYAVSITAAPAATLYTWNQTSAANFDVATNWTPNRTTLNLNDRLRFNGTGAVTVNNVPNQSVATLTVNNGNIVTLNASSPVVLNVTDSLRLTSGNFITGNNVISVGSSATSIGVITGTGKIDGGLGRWINGTVTTYSFPMVKGSASRQVDLSYSVAPTTNGILTVQFVATNPGNVGLPLTENGININRAAQTGYWALTPNGLTGGTYDATISAAGFANIANYASLVMIKRAGTSSPWMLEGTSVTTTGSNASPVLTRTGQTTYGNYGVGGDTLVNPLPVTLLAFNATKAGADVMLRWTTANEHNNAGFDVERSANGKDFAKIGFVEGAGNTSQVTGYALTDARAFEASNTKTLYYRLRQVDMDGAYTYSNTVQVSESRAANNGVVAQPNPFRTDLKAVISVQQSTAVTLVLTDMQGRQVSVRNVTVNVGSNVVSLDEANELNDGVYFLTAVMNGESTVTKVIKLK